MVMSSSYQIKIKFFVDSAEMPWIFSNIDNIGKLPQVLSYENQPFI
jgi:hypothetical protein